MATPARKAAPPPCALPCAASPATPCRGRFALAKLLAHPLLIGAVGHGAIALGVALDPAALTVLVLVACLPSASNVALLSERFGADSGRVARIILVSTALSFLSFCAAVFLLTS